MTTKFSEGDRVVIDWEDALWNNHHGEHGTVAKVTGQMRRPGEDPEQLYHLDMDNPRMHPDSGKPMRVIIGESHLVKEEDWNAS